MSETWKSVVDAIVYNAEYYPDLGEQAVDGTARALLIQPLWNLTPQQEYEAITYAIESRGTITSIPTRLDQAAIRDFLRRILLRLDDLKPWPEPRFQTLSISRWPEFVDSRPIAIINGSFPFVQDKVGEGFGQGPGDQRYFLLLQLNSGAEVGFIWPHAGDESKTTFVTRSNLAANDIIEEMIDASLLPPESFMPFNQPNTPVQSADPQRQFETTALSPEFRGENLPGNAVWQGKQVRYLTEQERQGYRVRFENGLAYDSSSRLLDTRNTATLWTPQGGRAIFVMDASGTLYWSPWHVLGEFHHSSLLAGAPVAGAGEIGATEGHVHLISDKSTHYRPEQRFTRQVVESLHNHGVFLNDSQVEINSPR
ncbi:hypothetical protein [Nocardia nova]|uniref:hypothetical protein n=1 Tax=Nocardia nova TaxID=37330 RepID=UPI0033C46A6E